MVHSQVEKQALLSPNSPSFWAGVLGVLAGIGMVAFSFYLAGGSATSKTLNVSIGVIGCIEIAVSYYTLRKVRVAWAFAISTNGTGFIVTLFSAPRIRDAADISIALALVPCLLFGLLVLLHTLKPEEF